MASALWVTAGAPLQTGDGWRVWYSWPRGDFTPGTPRVRTPAGAEVKVIEGPWEPKPPPTGSTRRMGVRELRLEGATPGALYEVTLPEIDRPLRWRTLPSELPPEGVSFLISSCFWINDDRDGFYASAVKELIQRERPMFKILMGDQLYADVWAPLPKSVPQGMAAKYERYWGDDAYREMLAACPTLVSCDDHEFWNDFPQPQIQVPLSWDRYQPTNGNVLAELYDAYQSSLNPDGKRWYSIELPPVSIFVADTRSNRTRDDDPNARLMVPEQWDDLETWAKNLKGPGVLVLPQPMMKAGGSKTDRTLVDFQESDRFGGIFERALGGENPHDILILTGDIHTGRLSSARIVGLPGRDLRARRLAGLAGHAVAAAVGPQAVGAPGQADRQSAHLADDREHQARVERRQQHRADQDRPRPQRPLPLHAAVVAGPVVHRHRQTDLRPQAGQGRATAPRPDRNRASLRRKTCSGTPRPTQTTRTSRTGRTATATPTTPSSSPTRSLI